MKKDPKGLVIKMSLPELLKEEQKCSTQVIEALKRSRDAMDDLDNAKSAYEEAHGAVAKARSVSVTWDQFFKLALDPDNYVQVKVEDPLKEWRKCRNDDRCHYANGNTEDRILQLEAMYYFDTVDKDFENQFIFCDRCIDTEGDDGLDGYVEWWLDDMAEEWSDFKEGRQDIRVDPEELSEEGKAVIGYGEPKKKR